MRPFLIVLAVLFSSQTRAVWSTLPQLPSAVTNNAVASYVHKDHALIFSFMGVGKEKDYAAITANAMVYDSRREEWLLLPPVPGKAGRIAAAAVVVDGQVYVLGGDTVSQDGAKHTVTDMDIYTPGPDEPGQGYWAKGVPIPIPVEDTVAGVVEDRYILLISGWSKDDNIANVQIYDTSKDIWKRGNVISGTPVFGHAGVIVNKTIIYCGGAYKTSAFKNSPDRPKFSASDECWAGKITSTGEFKIDWTLLPPHPGKARFRMAAGSWGKKAVFTGGTAEPYSYDGLDYSGQPMSPSPTTFAWNTENNSWETLPDNPEPTMDLRAMAQDFNGLVIVGGMESGQKVVKRVAHLTLQK